MIKIFLLVVLSADLITHFSKAATAAPWYKGRHVCQYKINIDETLQRYECAGYKRCLAEYRRLHFGRRNNYKYDCCPGWTNKVPLGCFSKTCISLPQDTPLSCKYQREIMLKRQQKIYHLTTPPEHLQVYPTDTDDIFEAVAFPLLNQTTSQVVGRSLASPFLHESKWALLYLGMSLRNKLVALKSLAPGYLTAFTSYSNYSTLMDIYLAKQQEPLLSFVNMEKYLRYPSQELPFKDIITADVWQEDDVFVQQRLAGLNPMSLRKMSSDDCFNSFINEDFDWDSAMKNATGIETTFDQMIENGDVFLLDYPLIDNIPDVPDIADIRPWDKRKMRPTVSPIAVFVSAEGDSGSRVLKPVAIQFDLDNHAPVNSPSDGAGWLLAKEEIQRADFVYVEVVEHLLKAHITLEPICVTIHRTLSTYHPLHEIFKWHCMGVFVTNSIGLPVIFGKNEFLHILSAMGNTGGLELINKAYPDVTWADTDFKQNLEKRGVDDVEKLPYFPYRDDGLLIWNVIGDFAEEYVNLYYEDDESVTKDNELQSFANELSDQGGSDGGQGMYKGFPAAINTKEEVIDIVKRIVFIPVQHHAVNYPVAYYGAFAPNMPTKLYDDPRVPNGTFGFHSLPQSNIATYQDSLSMTLGSMRYDQFFDYGDKLKDDRAKVVVQKYNTTLMVNVNAEITDRNNERLESGFLSYPYFLPPWMPNSIHT